MPFDFLYRLRAPVAGNNRNFFAVKIQHNVEAHPPQSDKADFHVAFF